MKRMFILFTLCGCAMGTEGASLFDPYFPAIDGGGGSRGSPPNNAQGGKGVDPGPGPGGRIDAGRTDTYTPPIPPVDAPITPPDGSGGSGGRPEGGSDGGRADIGTAGANGGGGSPPSVGGSGGSGPTAGAGGGMTIDVWSPSVDSGQVPPDAGGAVPDAAIVDSGPPCEPKTCLLQSSLPCGTMDDGCGHLLDCGDYCSRFNQAWYCGGGGPNTCGDCRKGFPADWSGDRSCQHPYACPHADFPYMSETCTLLASSVPGNFSVYCCPG